MPLPPELLQAISSLGGGGVALILGAGCSVETPTSIPIARIVSEEVHRHLVNDGILGEDECANPSDLSIVADTVFDRTGSQRQVVERLLARYNLKLATANEGYLIAAALLLERAISSVITLNFDLALSDALATLGAGSVVGIIESPQDLTRQKGVNVYYLHRNANSDPELWVLRSATLDDEWRQHWEPIIAAHVLTAPVVVFVGLGTPVAVLIESTRLIRNALPNASLYQVDPGDPARSQFFQEAGLDGDRYIRLSWGAFMDQLSQRFVREHMERLHQAIRNKIAEDPNHAENVDSLLTQLLPLGLVHQGKLRADWLLINNPYRSIDDDTLGLIADLFLALAMMLRVSGTTLRFMADGVLEFQRNGRTVAAYVLASGRGHRSISAVEAEIGNRRKRYDRHQLTLSGILVGGTSNVARRPTPPADISTGEILPHDLLGSEGLPIYHIDEVRAEPRRLGELLP